MALEANVVIKSEGNAENIRESTKEMTGSEESDEGNEYSENLDRLTERCGSVEK
jgi:hypothetical protein